MNKLERFANVTRQANEMIAAASLKERLTGLRVTITADCDGGIYLHSVSELGQQNFKLSLSETIALNRLLNDWLSE